MELLDNDLVLDAEGHLTELGAAALADGQHAILPPDALAHADHCPRCALLLGDQAMRAALVDRLLVHTPQVVPAPRLPWPSLVIAAALAALGLVPTVLSPEAREAPAALVRLVPPLLEALARTLQGAEAAALRERASWFAALTLLAAGLLLGLRASRSTPRPQGER